MDSNDRKLLRDVFEIGKENNRLLKKLHHAALWSRLFRLLYWIVIVGSMAGVYYYIQPIFSQILDLYDQISGGVGQLKNIGTGGLPLDLNTFNIPEGLFDEIKGLLGK